MRERKKFKETKVGNFLLKRLPDVVDAVGDVFPPVGILSALVGNRLTPEEKFELDRMLVEYEQRELEAYLQDVQDARRMQMEALQQEDKFSKRFIYWLAILVLLAAIFFGVGLMFIEIPDGNRRLIEMFADIFLFAGAIMVLQFFFGSSKGSSDKTYLISKSK